MESEEMAVTKCRHFGAALHIILRYAGQLQKIRKQRSAVKDCVRVDPGILHAVKTVVSRDHGTASGADQFKTGTLLAEWYLTSSAFYERQSLSAVPADFPFRVSTGLHLVLFPLSSTADGECRSARPQRELFVFGARCTYQKSEIISSISFSCDIRFLACAPGCGHGFGGEQDRTVL
jgi:hypothetical protein